MATEVQIADREALEAFKQEHPEWSSVQKIAAIAEDKFVQLYTAAFAGGSRQARRVYREAVALSEKALLIWANIKDAVASPYFSSTLFNNIPPEFIEHHRSIPGYDRLFGSLDFVETEECRSVLGAAAYFVDLVRFVDQYITQGRYVTSKGRIIPNSIPPQNALEDRRPDLFSIQLNCENTTELLPTIDLVNEVLELFIKPQEAAAATHYNPYALLEAAPFPMALPFNLPLTEIRSYLKQLQTSLSEIYKTFDSRDATANSDTSHASTQNHQARELLELSPRDYQCITSEQVTLLDLSEFYGIDVSLTGETSLEKVAVFLQQTGLTRQELNDLLFQDLDRHEVNAGLSRLFFINTVDDGLGYLEIAPETTDRPYEQILNLSAQKLDRIYRFLKLVRQLGWSFADLDWALRSLQPGFVPEKVLKFDGINDFVAVRNPKNLDLTSFTIEAWVNPARVKINPIVCKGIEAMPNSADTPRTHFLVWVDAANRLAFDTEQYDLRGSYTLPLNEFTHVAVTVTGENVAFYINGQPDTTTTYKLTDTVLATLSQQIPPIPPGVLSPLKSLLNESYTSEVEFLAAVELAVGKQQTTQYKTQICNAALVKVTPISAIGTDLNIGKDLDDNYFAGLIKEVRIWQGVRGAGVIADNRYRRFTGKEPGLVGYWTLTDDRPDALLDRTSNGNDGGLGGDELIARPSWVADELVLDALPQAVSDGTSYQLNGVDQYLAARGDAKHPDLGLDLQVRTLETWIRIDDLRNHPIICKGSGASGRAQFLLWVDAAGKVRFDSGLWQASYISTQSLEVGKLTHLAIALTNSSTDLPQLYLNGVNSPVTATDSFMAVPASTDLNLGRNLGNQYVKGLIREVRLWSSTRDADQIAANQYRPIPAATPGLIGYWRLDGTGNLPGLEPDRSFNRNDLFLGGITTDYMPERITVETLLPPSVQTSGTVVQFDGENDVILIGKSQSDGLGKYERLTLELWFNPTNVSIRDRQQVIYSQGDAEAGLSVSLFAGKLSVIAWSNNLVRTDVHEVVLQTDKVVSGKWQHLAIVVDEFPAGQPLGSLLFQAYLDDAELSRVSGTTDAANFRLSPVGIAYLGGIGQGGVTRFQGVYSDQPNVTSQSFFAGQITDVRLWKRAKTADQIFAGRLIAPTPPDADLIAYLPMLEGQGNTISDRSGMPTSAAGVLQTRNIPFATDGTGMELRNVLSHYTPATALTWSNYVYTGRLQLTDADGGVGVTFFSRYPAGQDRYYSLRRYKQRPTLQLTAYPGSAQPITGTIDAGVNPTPNLWYRFRIEVKDTGSQTTIRAKVWQDDTPEPPQFQIDAVDASPTRLTAGSVGIWAYGKGSKRFDSVRVYSIPTSSTDPSTLLLYETFESYAADQNPANWKDTGDRPSFDENPALFKSLPVGTTPTLGTTTELQSVYSHYATAEALTWKNYVYTGKLFITDPDSAIGVTVLSRYPDQHDSFYSLRRFAQRPAFHLAANPADSTALTGTVDSGIIPVANTWCQFRIEAIDNGSQTTLRAKVWQDGTPEPSAFQMQVIDNRTIRLTTGSVGVWAADSGSKYFAELRVDRLLLSEDFGTQSGQHPPNWIDTQANFSLNKATTNLFSTASYKTDIAFSTQATGDHVHSHYVTADSATWSNYVYTGRLLKTDPNGSVGVTLLSGYPTSQRYYRFRNLNNKPFEIAARQSASEPQENHPLDTFPILKGNFSSTVAMDVNVWYRFWFEVEDTGSRTNIRAKVWKDGTPEPDTFQCDAYDDSSTRLKAGTVGVWAATTGTKYYDDLRVFRRVPLLPAIPSNTADPDNWRDTGSHDPVTEEPSLFKTANRSDNNLQWVDTQLYPLLLRPLSARALQFDGLRKYLAAGGVQSLTLNEWTAEAWVKPTQAQETPVLLLQGTRNGQPAIVRLSLSPDGRLTLAGLDAAGASLQGTAAIALNTFTHIAVTVKAGEISLFVNGQPQTLVTSLPDSLTFQVGSVDVGRDATGHYFKGAIKEVRLWNSVHLPAQIIAGIYQRPELSADLIGYWAFDEQDGMQALDASGNSHPLQLGGVERVRRPVLTLPAAPSPTDFWRPDLPVLAFVAASDGISVGATAAPPVTRQQRTVEVWFRVENATLSNRKQVIYREGDSDRGLILYVYDGFLYFGGYNLPADESGWNGTWLQIGIESDRWHRAAIVLDGRAEIRPNSLRAYLDGRPVTSGSGSQLWQQSGASSLGGAVAPVRFHDGLAPSGDAPYFAGQILTLRVWNAALALVEIAANRYAQLTLPQPSLALWWQFDSLTGSQISDLSGNGRTTNLPDRSRIQPIGSLSPASLPLTSLSAATLTHLADIKALKDQYSLPIEKLTALWSPIKSTGRNDGKTLFDQVFNPSGIVLDRWVHGFEPALRWDITAQGTQSTSRDRDRQTRTRLMGALQISSTDLTRLVQQLSGTETVIELDTDYLTRLYHLARTAVALHLSIPDFLRLLATMNLKTVNSLADFQTLSERATWMQQTGFTVPELDFLSQDVGYQSFLQLIDPNIRDLADSLSRQSKDFLATGNSFTSDLLNQSQSIQIFQSLRTANVINQLGSERGAVVQSFLPPVDLIRVAANLPTDPDLRQKIQSQVDATLVRLRDEHANAILAGLATLFDVKPDLMQVVSDRFQAEMNPSQFLQFMLQIKAGKESDPIPANLNANLYKLAKVLYVVNKFALTPLETGILLTHPDYFSVNQVLTPSIADLDHLHTFQQLRNALGDSEGKLVGVLSQQSPDQMVPSLLALTDWDEKSLKALTQVFGLEQTDNCVESLSRLKACFDLAQTIGTSVDFLLQLADTTTLDLDFYYQQAAALLKVLRASYTDEQWEEVYTPIRNGLAVQKRDALLGLALEKLGVVRGQKKDPNLLYEFLLIDPQTGSEVETSRIVQGIASVQLYIQRCLMNLEAGVYPKTIPAEQWEWMKNFRVWQANRKVFFYPENYLEPELRQEKTPLFEELEQELMQTDINQTSVEKAYTNYLDKFRQVANLKIVGSYLHSDPNQPDSDKVLYLIGRTNSQPRIYYYRTLNVKDEQWTPWDKIELTINADFVTPVFAFNRLFLFWVEFAKSTRTRDRRYNPDIDKSGVNNGEKRQDGDYVINMRTGERIQENFDIFNPVVKYSYYNFSKSWIQPQTYLELTNELDEPTHLRPQWQRVYAQRALELVTSDATPVQTANTETNVYVLQLDQNTSIKRVVNPVDMGSLTWAFWVNFVNQNTQSTALLEDAAKGELVRSMPLFDYNREQTATAEPLLTVIAQNTVGKIAGVDNAQVARNAARNAANAAQAAATVAQAAANDHSQDQSAIDIANNEADHKAYLAEQAAIGANVPVDIVKATRQAAVQTRNAADFTRQAANGGKDDTAKKAASDAAQAAAQAAKDASTQASNAESTFNTMNKWQSTGMILRVQMEIATADLPLDFGWQSVAIVMEFGNKTNPDGYDITLYREGTAVSVIPFSRSGVLPRGRQLTIAKQAPPIPPVVIPSPRFITQMSDFSLWNRSLTQDEITAAKPRRKTPLETTFYLPLNREEVGTQMTLVPSMLNFDLPVALLPVPPMEPNRERILTFYGDTIRALRNTLEEDAFLSLSLKTNQDSNYNYYGVTLSLSNLHVSLARDVSIGDYAIAGSDASNQLRTVPLELLQSAVSQLDLLTSNPMYLPFYQWILQFLVTYGNELFNLENALLTIPQLESSVSDVGNQPGWYVLNTGEEQFLIRAEPKNGLETVEQRLKIQKGIRPSEVEPLPVTISFDPDPALAVQLKPGHTAHSQADYDHPTFKFKFERLSTFAVYALSETLFEQGLDGLLSLRSQQTSEGSFSNYSPNANLVDASTVTATIDFDGANGLYYREIFFYIPWFIASKLNVNHRFADAQKWYHYLFNPTAQDDSSNSNASDRYWQYLPFRHTLETLDQLLAKPVALAKYHADPFDPHAIADLRIGAYQKAIVMKYIDNLLDWGDDLFTQDTRESINEAATLYVLAATLLGPKPESKTVSQFEEIGTIRDVERANNGGIPEFLLLAGRTFSTPTNGTAGNGSLAVNPHNSIITTFRVKENEEFVAYWDRVADRLYKIRHSLSIEGIFRQLALFAPPINPMALVQAIAGGRDLSSVLSDLSAAAPHYRYSYMLDTAKDVVSTVIDLGSALLAALESQDAEKLEDLHIAQERIILNLVSEIKRLEKEETQKDLEGLEISKESITHRKQFFEQLIEQDVSAEEISALVLMDAAAVSRGGSIIAKAISAAVYEIPDFILGGAGAFSSPVELVMEGGHKAGETAEKISEAFDVAAEILEASAESTLRIGEYKRRKKEWEHERDATGFELQEIEKELAIAEIKLQQAEAELQIHQKELEHNQEIATFYREKFTNQELYTWMAGRLSALYFQAYKLAYDMAKSAEKGLQFELPTTESFISFGHWDSLRKGLLAGESLLIELHRMEKYHLAQDSRFQEIEKKISMARSFSTELEALKATGSCTFKLSEMLFDQDYPGHYNRQIKTVAISIKTAQEIDPFDSIHASLIQMGSKTLLTPDVGGVKYLLGKDGTNQPNDDVLRVNWRANQQIAISKPGGDDGDLGMFNLDFIFDNRYFPFEGTGAISDWRFEVPKESNPFLTKNPITDVIIHVRYIAKFDNGTFKEEVKKLLK